MTRENNNSLNHLFKNNIFKLKYNTKIIPNYLFNLNYLNIETAISDINFYNKLSKLKYLNIKPLIMYSEYHCEPKLNFEDFYLFNMTNLEELYLNEYSENIRGFCFKYFNNLKVLKLRVNCKLFDKDLYQFKNTLTTLEIQQVSSINGKCFKKLNNLTSLKINGNYITMEYLNYLINLKELKFINPHYFSFQNLQKLETLQIEFTSVNIDNNCVKDKNLFNLKNLKSLQIINCDEFFGDCFVYLQKLEYLKLKCREFKEENLQYLINLNTLIIKDQSISGKFFNYLKNLKKLKFISNKEFKEEYLKDLIYLENLSIPFTSKFTGKYLNNNLTKLNASNTKINEKYLFNLTKLKKLNLSDCKGISGNCFKYLKSLQKLNLTNVPLLTERHLNNLINLTELRIVNCNIYFGEFLLKTNNLQFLSLEGIYIDFKEKEILKIKEFIKKGNKFKEAVDCVLDELEIKEGISREESITIQNYV
ncbi:hypothetical protein ABK040_016891 [Willaertia magna]